MGQTWHGTTTNQHPEASKAFTLISLGDSFELSAIFLLNNLKQNPLLNQNLGSRHWFPYVPGSGLPWHHLEAYGKVFGLNGNHRTMIQYKVSRKIANNVSSLLVTSDVETGRSRVPGYPRLHSNFKASLVMRGPISIDPKPNQQQQEICRGPAGRYGCSSLLLAFLAHFKILAAF